MIQLTSEGAFPPALTSFVADINLGYPTLASKAEDGVDAIFAIQFHDFGVFLLGQFETLFHTPAFLG